MTDPALPDGPRRAKGTGVRLAYETLRDQILTLDLPPGALLDETMLAERLGMSRSPVREALIRLAGEDLVVTLANRSTLVAPLDVQGIPAYVEALDIAQRMNTRLAAELRRDSDLATIAARQADFEASLRSGNPLAMSKADKAFHMAIAEAGRNPWLSAFYGRLLDQGRRLLHLHFDLIERGRGGYLLTDEHGPMLDAIRDRDANRADALAHAHTRGFRETLVALMNDSRLGAVRLGG